MRPDVGGIQLSIAARLLGLLRPALPHHPSWLQIRCTCVSTEIPSTLP